MRHKNERLTFSDRKIINHMLSHNEKLVDISVAINCDPRTISKEIKRNRVIFKDGLSKEKCAKLDRYPYTCNGCQLKYSSCVLRRYVYDAEKAQKRYEELLKSSRVGLDTTKEKFEMINNIIKEGVDNKDGIYHIVKSHDEIDVSIPTIYRWIHKGYMKTKPLDLPYLVKYKPRNKNKEKYDYSISNRNIDRSGRTFGDYLRYRVAFPGLYTSQIDFLGTIKTDTNDILSLIIPELHFPILKLFKNPNQLKLKEFFDELEISLGTKLFYKIFPAILGDRDPIFNDYNSIENSCYGNDNVRCLMFYCDPYESTQKPFVENVNKQLRIYFPKGVSIDAYTEDTIKNINNKLIERKIRSLGGLSPKEMFIKVYGLEAFNKLIKVIL